MPSLHLTQHWRLNLPYGTPYQSVFHPECFAHFGQMQPGQRIEVLPEDMSYIAELVVSQVNNGTTRVHELWKHNLPPAGASNVDTKTGGYEAFHVGAGRWKVKRLAFTKPNGTKWPEHIYPGTFDSEAEAKLHIQRALVGTR